MEKEKILKLSSYFVTVIGLIVSLYLAWVKLAQTEPYCGGSAACQTVNSSPFAEISGIPIAYLGVGAYLIILGLLFVESKYLYWEENSQFWVFGISLIGVLYSAYLTFIEIAVIKAVCPYCVVSAIAMVLVFGLTILRLTSEDIGNSLVEGG